MYKKEGTTRNDELPHMIMAFNSPNQITIMPGFPCLLKEIAEIPECGSLDRFDFINFIECIERYASI